MYSMLSTPLICASIGAATESASVLRIGARDRSSVTVTCTGVIVGYCSIGSARIATSPASTMMIETTAAKIGRSMKKRENISGAAKAISTRRACAASAPPTTLAGGFRRKRSAGTPAATSASRTALARCFGERTVLRRRAAARRRSR